MRKKIFLLGIIVLVIGLGVGIGFWFLKYKKIDNNLKYVVTTDFKYQTMLNDGGSHTSKYYEIDLKNKLVVQKLYKYTANLGGKPKEETTTVYTKKINKKLAKEIKLLLDNLINKEDINDSKNYHSFSIQYNGEKKIIFNQESINNLKKLFIKVDNY